MEHDRHAFRLLRFACVRALEQECDVLLVAQPGWSFKRCKNGDSLSPEVAELMKRVGYFTPKG
jgi:hypothetical protein